MIRTNKHHWALLLLASIAAYLLAQAIFPEQSVVLVRAITVVALIALATVYLLHLRIETQLTRQLEESEKSVQTILDGIADPTIIVDKEFRITAMNNAARDALPDNVAVDGPVHCYRALHGLEQPCSPSERTCAMQSGQSGKEIQMSTDDDGRNRHVEIRSTPLHDEAGTLSGVIEVVHNLNEQEEIALKLERARVNAATANRARSEFISTMSHEVRTPMNAVLGMADLLRLSDLKRKQETYVQIIESSGNMLLSLVDNMLDFSTLESGKLVLHKEEFLVADLLEQVLKIMGYQAYSKGLELIGDSQDDLRRCISADAQRLRQILINLLGNAIKFTNTGEIVVKVEIEGEEPGPALLIVEVEDSGIGMSEETLASLFDPFMRAADGNGHVQEQGSGLGLAISKQLVDLMGGEVNISSELGQGTRARLSVPVDLVPESDAAATHRGPVLKTRRMLVVDDNDRISRVLCRNLMNWGMQCESVRSPGDVLGILAAAQADGQSFDGVIIDFDLPESNGLALARAIRAGSVAAYLPMILLTSIARSLEVGEISSIGGIRCVNKPILPSELRHNLFKVLEVDDWQGKHAEEDELKELRILIAEDNPLNRKLLSRMLESLGHSVECADNGPAALRAFEENSHDLILMDCQMPGLDGDEVTQRIRDRTVEGVRQPIIVAVTADISAEHKSKCLAAGMDDFLAKPIRLQVLKSGLRRWSSLIGDAASTADESEQSPQIEQDQQIVARLRDRAGDDGTFINDYIDLFLRDTATRLEIMRAAVEHEDQVTLGRECHALKGACLEVGVPRLGVCCDALQHASKNQQFDAVATALLRLIEEFERVTPLFEAEKNASPSRSLREL